MRNDEPYRWQPALSVDGPLSIIISRQDRRLVVMRNGVEIGRSKVDIKNPIDSVGTAVFVAHHLNSPPPDTTVLSTASAHHFSQFKWIGVSFDGARPAKAPQLEPLGEQRITIPPTFLAQLLPAITTGTSMVLTYAPILESTTGIVLTLLTSSPVSE